jgi:tetratricopeptide (TPR) repeat protein
VKLRRSAAVLVVCAVSIALFGIARAQDPPDPPDPKAAARQHYEAGVRAYNLGDFDLAIREWSEGYRLHGSPDFLFNIAQAHRGKRDYAQALFFFESFLRERPDAPNVVEVRVLRDEMEQLLTKERQSKERPPKDPIATFDSDAAGAAQTGAASPETAQATDGPAGAFEIADRLDAPRPESGRTLKLAGLGTGGAGVALVATGVVFSLSARSAERDLEAAARRGDPWTEELESKDSSARRNATLGVVFLSTGVAAGIAAGALYYLGHRADADLRRVTVSPSAGGHAGLSIGLVF